MDFSKLSSDEKRTVIAAVVVGVLAIYALVFDWGGLMALSLLGAIGALAIVLMPQMSPGTSLPGSRGSLLLIAAGAAALFWALTTLVYIGYISRNLGEVDTWIFLVGLAVALWLAWQAWQAFQAEGGKFILGPSPKADAPATAGASGTDSAEPASTAAPAAPAEPAATSAPAETMTTPPAEHVEEHDEDPERPA